jgi:hypothetical protein
MGREGGVCLSVSAFASTAPGEGGGNAGETVSE